MAVREQIRCATSVLNQYEKRRCAVIVSLNLLGAVIEIALIGTIPFCVAVLADRSVLDRLPLVTPDISFESIPDATLLGWMTVTIVVLAACKLLFFFGVQIYIFRTVHRLRIRMSRNLFDAYLHAPWTFHLQNNSSELLRNCTSEISEYIHGVFLSGLSILHGVIMLAAVLVFIIATLPALAILALVVTLGSIALLMLWLRKRLDSAGRSSRLERKHMLAHVQEGLANLVHARLTSSEKWFLARYVQSATTFSLSQVKIALVSRVLPFTVEFVSVMGLMLVVTLLVKEMGSAAAAAPQIAIISVGLLRMRQATSNVASNASRFQFSLPTADSIREHTVEIAREPLSESDNPFQFNTQMQLEGINFSYEPIGEKVLSDVSVTVARGQSIAFIGETGCGKSTLLQVCLGLLKPQTGRLTVDGKNVFADLRGWQNMIGYVPQQVHLLDTSIIENIVLGDSNVDRARLDQAIRIAQLESVIASQPHGLETVVGENGTRLSGGQRQRIALARALYRQPEVIILDEATSALDHQTEAAITGALSNVPWTSTKIIVAHRLSTVQDCDLIVMLKDGRVLDQGAFDELRSRHSSLQTRTAG